MVVIIFLTTFNSWWLSHWLEQGSGVSVMVGMKCVFYGLEWSWAASYSLDPMRVRIWVVEPDDKPRAWVLPSP